MKKNIRIIIIVLAIVLVLGGVTAVLLLTSEEEEEETVQEEVKTSLLYDKNPDDLAKLTIENSEGSYQVTRLGEGDSAVWTVEELAGLPLSGTAVNKLLNNACSVTAQQTVTEAPEDISIYGLDAPSAVVTAEFDGNAAATKKLIIGNLTPEETKRYVMVDEGSTVYTVYNSVLSCYLENKYSVISKVVYTAKSAADENDTTSYTQINKMTIQRADLDYDVVIEYDARLDDDSIMTGNSSNYIMSAPIVRDLNPETSQDITDSIFGLTASDLAVLNPKESDFEEYGISSPAAEVSFEINGGDTVRLRIGNECFGEDGKKEGRFVHADGINVIYIFPESSLPWLTFSPLNIVTTMFTSNYIYDLEGLDITGSGHELRFEISGAGADDFAVTRNGQTEDADRFKTLYQYILRAPSTELYFEDPGEEPVLTVNIRLKSGENDLIEFIPAGNRQAVVRLNGEPTYKCAQAYVDRFIANLELYENGEDIVQNW